MFIATYFSNDKSILKLSEQQLKAFSLFIKEQSLSKLQDVEI